MIYLARHGDKLLNGCYNAALDILDEPLSDKGFEDARHIAACFESIPLEKIIVSEYMRTQQTAAPVAEIKGLRPVIDSRVNEINGGFCKQMTTAQIAAAYPDFWRDFNSRLIDARYPGGESGADVKRRQDSFLNDMKQEKGNVLVVTHDGFIRLLLCNILEAEFYNRYRLKTTMGGISAIEFDPAVDSWVITQFNQT